MASTIPHVRPRLYTSILQEHLQSEVAQLGTEHDRWWAAEHQLKQQRQHMQESLSFWSCATKPLDTGALQDQLEHEVAQLGTDHDRWWAEEQQLKHKRQHMQASLSFRLCATKQHDTGTLQDQLESDVAQLVTDHDRWWAEQHHFKQERQHMQASDSFCLCATQQLDTATLQEQLQSEVAQLGTEHDSWRGEQQLLKQERQQLTDQLIDAKQKLAAALSNAKQQQQRDQTYQDELVTDKQEALQVWSCAYAYLQADVS